MTFYPIIHLDCQMRNGGSVKYCMTSSALFFLFFLFFSDVITQSSKGERTGSRTGEKGSNIYQNETMEPCYLSSSIYYGGQENYSPRTRSSESDKIVSEFIYSTSSFNKYKCAQKKKSRRGSSNMHRE
jgi:hypothetical protein